MNPDNSNIYSSGFPGTKMDCPLPWWSFSRQMSIFFMACLGLPQFGLADVQLPRATISIEKTNNSAPEEVQMKKGWMESLFKEDNEEILTTMEGKIESWDKTYEYGKTWNLESTGLYSVDDEDEKINFLTKNTLKYLDKRLAKEMKGADEGSTLKKVEQVQNALRPTTKVEISEDIKLKFKAQVLQGKATLLVDNPFFYWAANFNARGNVGISMFKELDDLGVKTILNYSSKDGTWEAAVNKQLNSFLSSTVSSKQDASDMAFTNESDKKVEVNFSQPF